MQLAQKVAVVTGAGSGIGRALAQELAGRGCRLALFDVDEAGLAETARRSAAARWSAASTSATSRRVTQAAAAVVEQFGQVDVVFNNAGIAHGGRAFWELPPADFARVLDVNFWGVVHGTRAFLPHLMTRPEAAVVNTSSIFGVIGVTRQSAYCSSKFAVRGFTETLRMELRESAPHVRTLAVHPGGVKTAIAERALRAGVDESEHREAAQAFEKIARTTPAARPGPSSARWWPARSGCSSAPTPRCWTCSPARCRSATAACCSPASAGPPASALSPLKAPAVPIQPLPPVTGGLSEVAERAKVS